ncbi:roadblock/LC7 domain-containing protein [Parathalassolituus penaei]|uniref:Roadblock/LC7 domain-containing protein n=1 Tax=Parathalassolituus penaei TaxID=2997323 RepID=A0A9X3ED79_9GAMM|nr:roadblock/LC7 domain-containing protein [Parathalassolituus penaei]MCY0964525.1 roadblock/LC7 domain-containing protein [Parathalassolituus penaei]
MNTSTRQQLAPRITATLRSLISHNDCGMVAAAVMSTDGFIIGSALRDDTNQDVFAAMNASLLVLAQRSSREIAIGELRQVMVLGTEGVMHLTCIGNNAVLAIATDVNANIGSVVLQTRRVSVRLQDILETPIVEAVNSN